MEFTSDEISAAGRKIYESIREEMETNHWGELVVIDVHSGDYEVGEFVSRHSELKLFKRLRQRQPKAFTWAILVGHGAPYYREANRPGLIPVAPEKKSAHD